MTTASIAPVMQKLPLLLLFVLVLTMFMPAPWRLEVTLDEMLHLESWRNRYDEPIIAPLVMDKIEATGRLSEQQFEQLRQIMLDHHWLQRLVLPQLGDGFPPLYGWLAEAIAAVTDSSLLAMRIPSLLGALVALWALFQLGRELGDPVLGYWLVAFQAVCSLTQLYAGIGRAYALGHGALALALWLYVRWGRHPDRPPAAFLAAALLAQSLTWFCWPLLLPLVAHVVLLTWHAAARPVRALLRRCGWHAAASLCLLPFVALQMLNPSIHQKATFSPSALWAAFASASPFGHLLSLGSLASALGAAVFLVLVAVGVRELHRSSSIDRGVARALTASLVVGGLSFGLWPALDRRLMPWMLVAGVVASVAGWALAGRGRGRSLAAVSVVLAGFLLLGLVKPVDPFRTTLRHETDFAAAAHVLDQELGPADRWTTYPYYISNPFYRYAELPEPMWPMTPAELATLVRDRSDTGGLFVWMRPEAYVLSGQQRDLWATIQDAADARWEFTNGYLLVRLQPAAASPQQCRPAPASRGLEERRPLTTDRSGTRSSR